MVPAACRAEVLLAVAGHDSDIRKERSVVGPVPGTFSG